MSTTSSAFTQPLDFDINRFTDPQAFDGSVFNPYSLQNATQNPMYAQFAGNMNAQTLNALPGANLERAMVSSSFNDNMAQSTNMQNFLADQSAQNVTEALPGQTQGVNANILAARGSEFNAGNMGADTQPGFVDQMKQVMGLESAPKLKTMADFADESKYLDYMKAEDLKNTINNSNSFDWGGAFDTGLSAFNAFNQYKYQNDTMDLYKSQIAEARAERTRKNTTRDAWSNAYN